MEEQIGGKYRMELSQTQFSLSTDSIVLADFARVFSVHAELPAASALSATSAA